MSVVVIQLARFGDIFQTWPTLKALRRQAPGEPVHLIVRERFQAATWAAADAGVTVHVLPSADLLAPLIAEADDRALEQMQAYVRSLCALQPRRVINLSFSPFSSYLSEALSEGGIPVAGYTRHSDGYLNIPDDTSAYFYAQVGIDRGNRYHLTDIFAAVAGVELIDEDFTLPVAGQRQSRSVVVHIGASQNDKAYPPEMWREVLRDLQAHVASIIVVGSADERAVAQTITAELDANVVHNRCGTSTLAELCRWVAETELVMGADSAPVHIAALTGTPVLNLSCRAVNFWETGPHSAGSRVLWGERMSDIPAERVTSEALAMLAGQPGKCHAVRATLRSDFTLQQPGDDFLWRLIQALYTQADYPELPVGTSALAFQRLFDTAELALSQLGALPDAQRAQILANVDEILTQLPRLDDRVGPVVNWFETERLRIAPAAAEFVLERTRELFEQLLLIAAVYHRPRPPAELLSQARELARVCAPALREFEFPVVQDHFQELLSVLQDLSRHTTKVGDATWSSVLSGVQSALARRDFVELADALEFDLDVIV